MAGRIIFLRSPTPIPTNTWDPLHKDPAVSLTPDHLTSSTTGGSVYQSVLGLSTFAHSSGKYYYEILITTDTGNSMTLGVGTSGVTLSKYAGQENISWGIYALNGAYYHAGTTASGVSFGPGDVIGVAVDLTAGKIWFRKGSTWMSNGSPGDPVAGTFPAMTGLTGTLMPLLSNYNICNNTANFGASTYANAAPTGYSNW